MWTVIGENRCLWSAQTKMGLLNLILYPTDQKITWKGERNNYKSQVSGIKGEKPISSETPRKKCGSNYCIDLYFLNG